MAIIAIISTFGISAFIGARDQAIVSDAAEKLLSSLREAQNRSISITKGKDTDSRDDTDTVVWGVKVGSINNSFSLIYLDIEEGTTKDALDYVQETPIVDIQVTISTSYVNGASGVETIDNTERYIFYSAPFAKASTAQKACTPPDTCIWKQSNNQAQDWGMSTGNGFSDPRDEIKIDFTYKDHSQSIYINSRGDSYLE